MNALPELRSEGARVELRRVLEEDLPILFEHQLDPLARHRVAFAAEDSTDRAAYLRRWRGHLADEGIVMRAIYAADELVGHVVAFHRNGEAEVGYWLGREHWGRGLATQALRQFLCLHTLRPLQARVAVDNRASLRVLEKCGFRPLRRERAFANVRGVEIEELILVLESPSPATSRP